MCQRFMDAYFTFHNSQRKFSVFKHTFFYEVVRMDKIWFKLNVRCQFLWLLVIPAEKFCGSWVLSTSVCGTGSFSAHTATHSINGSAHETQNFSAGITENKKSGNKHCQQTHLTPPNIHDIVESRLRISQEGAHHLGCGLFCGILLLYQKRKERRYDLLEWKPGFRL